MSAPPDYLYGLLPAVYRNRDQAIAGGDEEPPLKALLAALQTIFEAFEDDIEALYHNAFVETCAPWAIPYIGDLLDVPMLHQGTAETFTLRSYVADTLAFRRRKGTAVILAHVARALGGWPALAREGTDLVAVTQNVNAVIADAPTSPDVSDTEAIARIATPFTAARRCVSLVSVREMIAQPDAIDLFVWTTQSYPVTGATAWKEKVEAGPAGRGWGFTFDPHGRDLPLFNRPRRAGELTTVSRPADLPGPLSRLALYEDLNALRRRAKLDIPPFQQMPLSFDWRTAPAESQYFGEAPVLSLTIDDEAVPPERLAIANIETWWRLPASALAWVAAAVDPVTGRIVLPESASAERIVVDYSYGGGADLGAGPYDRADDPAQALPEAVEWWCEVTKAALRPLGAKATIGAALAEWKDFVARHGAVTGAIVVSDSATYAEALTEDFAVSAPAGSTLLLIAGRLPAARPHATAAEPARPWSIDMAGVRPAIVGPVRIDGGSAAAGRGTVIVDGFLIAGDLSLDAAGLDRIGLGHLTVLRPERTGPVTAGPVRDATSATDAAARLVLTRSMIGGLTLTPAIVTLDLDTSLVDGDGGDGIGAPWTPVTIRRSTILGTTRIAALDASDTLFAQAVTAARQQIGRVIFSYVPAGSRTPRRYRCQPDLAEMHDPTRAAAIRLALTPVFESTAPGDPGYGRLSPLTDARVREGASDGAEIGVFGVTLAAQRRANLDLGLADYLRITATATITAAP